MNGQQGSDRPGQGSQESHLAYLLNSAAAGGHGAAGLMGYPGALSAVQRLGFGGGDAASLEEQILQRASALRAEAFLQQQQQQHQHQQQTQQRHHHLGAALAALQQQQLSAMAMNPSHLNGLSAQEQEILLGRAAALRELGAGATGIGMERLQQLELGRLEELERRRQQLAALTGFGGAPAPPRPAEVASTAEKVEESVKSESRISSKAALAASAATSAQDSQRMKDDLRKTPGTVIVPCRARGMPMDHNFKTAYFVISEETKHGEDLVCSYYSCRNGGVKFRYCAHCMAPVAKRNFCRRHDHGLSDKLSLQEDDDDESMDENKGVVDADVAKKTPPMTSSLDILSKAASSSIAAVPTSAKPKLAVAPSKEQKAPVMATVDKEVDHDDDVETDVALISKKRRKAWSSLLIKRPRTKDPRHLSSWLNEVLAVSDFDNELELDGPESTHPTMANADDEAGPISAKKESKPVGEKKKRKSGVEKAETKTKKIKTDAKQKQKKSIQEMPSTEKEAVAAIAEVGKQPSQVSVEGDQEGKENPVSSDTKAISENEGSGSRSSAVDSKAGKPRTHAPEGLEASREPASAEDKELEDGFAGSFADWRERKKDKVKKSPGSLKK